MLSIHVHSINPSPKKCILRSDIHRITHTISKSGTNFISHSGPHIHPSANLPALRKPNSPNANSKLPPLFQPNADPSSNIRTNAPSNTTSFSGPNSTTNFTTFCQPDSSYSNAYVLPHFQPDRICRSYSRTHVSPNSYSVFHSNPSSYFPTFCLPDCIDRNTYSQSYCDYTSSCFKTLATPNCRTKLESDSYPNCGTNFSANLPTNARPDFLADNSTYL